MIAHVIEWCATRRWLVIILSVIAFVGAVMTMRKVPLDAIPDLSDPQVIVFTDWMAVPPTWSRTRSRTRSSRACSPHPR